MTTKTEVDAALSRLAAASARLAEIQPLHAAFLSTLSFEDELNRSMGKLPPRPRAQIEDEWAAALAEHMAANDAYDAVKPAPNPGDGW